ncbi:atrial natriuretic peptide receptor 3-like [Saccoglossus kowalevskii]|uniref:Atrial natriuretic peptide receptor 1-like n=1 Tax=Saccoglossus kowalevskii TaxID=10224 RepID=A0ABM0MI31_SACKO|nr:PREDICTED: atrial natriuretic peptide receptor 1-like [Saccoglossus kowalevskii]
MVGYMVLYRWFFFIFAFFQYEYAHSASSETIVPDGNDFTQVKMAVILPKDTDQPPEIRHYPYRFEMVCPAIDIAVEGIKSQEDFFGGRNVTLAIRKADSACSNLVSPIRAVEFITEKQVDVFFGPACDYAAAAVARFAAHWDIPFLTTGAKAKEFGMKDMADFSTLTRVHGPFLKMAEFTMSIFRHFQWNTTAILHNDKDVSLYRDCWLFGGALFHLFHGAGWYDPGKDYAGYQKFIEEDDPDYTEILKETVIPNARSKFCSHYR